MAAILSLLLFIMQVRVYSRARNNRHQQFGCMGKRWLQVVPPSVWTRKQEDRRFESVLSLTCYCNIRVDFTTNRQLEAFSSMSTQVSSTWKQAVNLCHYHFRAWNVEVAQYLLGWWKNRFGRHLNKVNFWSKFLIYDDNSRSVSLYSFRIHFHWKI